MEGGVSILCADPVEDELALLVASRTEEGWEQGYPTARDRWREALRLISLGKCVPRIAIANSGPKGGSNTTKW